MNLSQLAPHLLHQFKSESDLVKAIEELSRKFTVSRESIGDYLNDRRLVAAYCSFYLTTNFPKLAQVMKWMPTEWCEQIKQCELIDLGAGPGTFSLAWKQWAQTSHKVYQLEKSPLMREQARKIWDGFYAPQDLIQLTQWSSKSDLPKLVLFGHAANEMGAEQAIRYLEAIDPDHVLFIEPGTKSFFPEMLKIRDYLLQKKHQVIFPCPKELACPMQDSVNDWCHQFIQVRHTADVERLTQMVEKDRKLLPLIVHAYSKARKFYQSSERIVRVLPETKFSLEWDMCHDNQLEHYQIMKKSMPKNELKSVSNYLSGQAVETETEKEFDGIKRVKITRIYPA